MCISYLKLKSQEESDRRVQRTVHHSKAPPVAFVALRHPMAIWGAAPHPQRLGPGGYRAVVALQLFSRALGRPLTSNRTRNHSCCCWHFVSIANLNFTNDLLNFHFELLVTVGNGLNEHNFASEKQFSKLWTPLSQEFWRKVGLIKINYKYFLSHHFLKKRFLL